MLTKSLAHASERMCAEFFEVVESLLAVNTPQQFCVWSQSELQRVFPHGMLVCGIGRIEAQGVDIRHILSCNFPQEYIQTLQQPGGLTASPILAQWVKTMRPVLFEMTAKSKMSAWLENFQRYGLGNLAAHGLCDLNSRAASYFSFSQIPGKLTPHHAHLLELLVPHLHVALTRAFSAAKRKPRKITIHQPSLTGREKEILQWLGTGKTSWEIAQVLHISENTVKNHVQHVLTRLKVNTRAQAVAKAINLKLIHSKFALALGIGMESLLEAQETFESMLGCVI